MKGKGKSGASERLSELEGRLSGLQDQRKRSTERMQEDDRRSKVDLILHGEDPDAVMADHLEALTSID